MLTRFKTSCSARLRSWYSSTSRWSYASNSSAFGVVLEIRQGLRNDLADEHRSVPLQGIENGGLKLLIEALDRRTGSLRLAARPGGFERRESRPPGLLGPELPFEVHQQKVALEADENPRHPAGRIKDLVAGKQREAVAVQCARHDLPAGRLNRGSRRDEILGGGAREGHDHDAGGIDAGLHQPSQALDERVRFPGARACKRAQRPRVRRREHICWLGRRRCVDVQIRHTCPPCLTHHPHTSDTKRQSRSSLMRFANERRRPQPTGRAMPLRRVASGGAAGLGDRSTVKPAVAWARLSPT